MMSTPGSFSKRERIVFSDRAHDAATCAGVKCCSSGTTLFDKGMVVPCGRWMLVPRGLPGSNGSLPFRYPTGHPGAGSHHHRTAAMRRSCDRATLGSSGGLLHSPLPILPMPFFMISLKWSFPNTHTMRV